MRHHPGRAIATLLAHGTQVAHTAPMGGPAPEDLERLVKQRQVGAAMHQQGAGSEPEIVATAADGHELGGAHQVQHIG